MHSSRVTNWRDGWVAAILFVCVVSPWINCSEGALAEVSRFDYRARAEADVAPFAVSKFEVPFFFLDTGQRGPGIIC
jgi:hypothetical protein